MKCRKWVWIVLVGCVLRWFVSLWVYRAVRHSMGSCWHIKTSAFHSCLGCNQSSKTETSFGFIEIIECTFLLPWQQDIKCIMWPRDKLHQNDDSSAYNRTEIPILHQCVFTSHHNIKTLLDGFTKTWHKFFLRIFHLHLPVQNGKQVVMANVNFQFSCETMCEDGFENQFWFHNRIRQNLTETGFGSMKWNMALVNSCESVSSQSIGGDNRVNPLLPTAAIWV